MFTGYALQDGARYSSCSLKDKDALVKHMEKEMLRLRSEQSCYKWTFEILPGETLLGDSDSHIPY